ncbi:sarcosine oxidase subunit gamma [Aestuariispira ectoiniformans]|uniref:sarcosine oxidase subunit gamma n=1 Tax=Aestuariispira ectoiniformans TaxID=2775080 RepID=UPI00223B2EA6|nr:sarcosine oxidase subunit gamma family protein [Aestuariispira ectoiniformans]
MANSITKTSPLDGLAKPAGSNVRMEERPFVGKVTLRGNPEDKKFLKAVEDVLGVALPLKPCSFNSGATYTAYWVGPDEWQIYTPEDGQNALVTALRAALEGMHSQVVDVSDYYVVIRISGPAAREVLMKGSPLDVHPRAFQAGQVRGTRFANATIQLSQVDDAPTFDVQIRWSFAEYLWNYFLEAAKEFG